MKSKFKLFVTIILSFAMAFSMIACRPNDDGDNDGANNSDGQNTPTTTAQSFVSIDINPSIELTVDENDVVVSVYGANEDGQILLHGETDLKGKSVDEVVEKITDLAVEYGYLTEENKVVNTSVTSVNQQVADALKNKVNAKISARGNHFGFEIKTDGEGVFSLMREYEKFIAENPSYKNVLSLDKFKLALSVSEEGNIDLNVAVEMDESELIDLANELHGKLEGIASDMFKKARKEAERIYNKAVDSKLASVYDTFYSENITSHPITGLYRGKLYKAYKTAEIGFECLEDAIEIHDAVEEFPLTNEIINSVIEPLGLTTEDIALLMNKDGDVTIESIEDYLDKEFKNAVDNADKEALEDAIESLLDSIEEQLEGTIKLSKYNGDLSLIKTQIETQLNVIKAIPVLVKPEEVNNFISDMETLIESINVAIENGINVDDIDNLADLMEDGADEILELIEAELSTEEKAEIEEMKKELVKECQEDKDRFESAMNMAEESAKDYLQGKKEELMQKHPR